jgi:hypothetical protein
MPITPSPAANLWQTAIIDSVALVTMGAMMAESSDQQPGKSRDDQPKTTSSEASTSGPWANVIRVDSWYRSAASLTIVTVIVGWFGTYIQYLNAYEDKVRDQAKADMTAATDTFVDISNAFAQAQALQEIVYFNFRDAVRLYRKAKQDDADTAKKHMITEAGKKAFDDYVKARTALREKSGIYARKAELYIDWASNLKHDPAAKYELNQDPLTQTLLGVYNFNCDTNLPRFKASEAEQIAEREDKCAKPSATAKQYCNKGPVKIDWQSAKHHVVTMYYCFDLSHNDLEAARIWAAGSEIDATLAKNEKADQIESNLNNQVLRLNAFMSLTMSQLETIRVKYRPSSFSCNIPLINYLIKDRCTPVKIAESPAAK